MFTCLEILPEREGVFIKLRERIKPPVPVREYVQVRGGTPFLRLKVRENHMDWRMISSVLTGKERRLIAEQGLEVPESLKLARACPASLGTKIMFRTACDLLAESDRKGKISFSLYDKNGACADMLENLVPLVRYVSVYTEKIREYFFTATKIMRESGMSIKINEYESAAVPGEIIVADRYCRNMKDAKLIFLADSSVISYNTVTGSDFSLEDEYRCLTSSSVDDFLFASALYEYNNVKIFEERKFARLFLAGREEKEEALLSKIGNT